MVFARLLSAKPTTDGEHWDLTFRFHNDRWHTDAYGQNPTPWQRNPGQLSNSIVYPWRPTMPVWGGLDALFPLSYGMGVALNTANSPATLDITGLLPVNATPTGSRPQVPLTASITTSGGNIPAGAYLIHISASLAGPTGPFATRALVASGSTNKIVVSPVGWSAAAVGPIAVFIGPDSQHLYGLDASAWVGSSPDPFGNPTVFTITALQATGPLTQADGAGLPDTNFSRLLIQAKLIIHGGDWGSAPSSVGSSAGHATATFAGAAWTTNQWANRILSSYQAGASGPLNWLVDSNTSDTLTFHTSHGPMAGQVVVMRMASAHISANTIGSDTLINSFSPSGLTPGAEVGNLVRIIAGTGAGQQPPIPIAGNTATVVTLMQDWLVQPDATSIWIIEGPSWPYSIETDTLHFDGTIPASVVASLPIPTFNGGSLLIEAITLDSNDNWSIERYAPIREIYVPPVVVPAGSDGYFTITPSGGVAVVDLANGLDQRLVLNASAVTIAAPTFTGGTINAGAELNLHFDQDATGGRAVPAFTGGASGFVSSTQAQIEAVFDGTLSTRTSMTLKFHGTYWALKGQASSGTAIS